MRALAPELPEGAPAADGPFAAGRAGVWLVVAWAVAALPLVVIRGLSLDHVFAPSSYLPLHTLVELAISVVGFSTAAVQWYAAGAHARDARARFVGAAFLGATILETVHALVFPGMPGFLGPASVERGIYYWLLARGWLVAALLGSAFVSPESERPLLGRGPLTVANLAVAVAGVVFETTLPASPGIFYHPGSGLTRLKVVLEGCIALGAAAGALLHVVRWRASGDRSPLRIAAALGLVAASEVSFALYASAYDLYNLLGHLYALAAAALIFDGLFVTAIIRPYRRLDAARAELAASHARLDALRAHVEGELAETIVRLEDARVREASVRAELEAAVAAVPDAMVVYAPDGTVVRSNAAARALFAYSPEMREAPAAARWARLSPVTTDGKPLPPDHNPLLRALRGEVVSGVPMAITPPGRRQLWISMSAAPTRGQDGRITGAIAAMTDVSALQALQSQRDDLLRAVSHDLRNPLQIVLLQAERLQRLLGGTPLEKERTSAERIAVAAKHMGVMIRDLVEAARMETGGLALAREPVDLGAFVPRVLEQLAGGLDVARVRLEVAPELPRVFADPARLERVVTNLVSNALKYAPGDSEVLVRAERRGDEVAVTVRDSGLGIAPDDLPRLFERFYRGKATQKADGLGLGLFIVRLLVDAHGGRVWAESRPGEGATFTFTLPVVRPG